VTNRDVEFWLNILKVEKGEYLGYSPGSIPDDIASMSFPASSPYQFSITFNKAYSPLWVLYDELSEIVPVPQYAWDKTSASSPVGNYDTTAAGAKAVWKFMKRSGNPEGHLHHQSSMEGRRRTMDAQRLLDRDRRLDVRAQ